LLLVVVAVEVVAVVVVPEVIEPTMQVKLLVVQELPLRQH
jgi:hypothetical protein